MEEAPAEVMLLVLVRNGNGEVPVPVPVTVGGPVIGAVPGGEEEDCDELEAGIEKLVGPAGEEVPFGPLFVTAPSVIEVSIAIEVVTDVDTTVPFSTGTAVVIVVPVTVVGSTVTTVGWVAVVTTSVVNVVAVTVVGVIVSVIGEVETSRLALALALALVGFKAEVEETGWLFVRLEFVTGYGAELVNCAEVMLGGDDDNDDPVPGRAPVWVLVDIMLESLRGYGALDDTDPGIVEGIPVPIALPVPLIAGVVELLSG